MNKYIFQTGGEDDSSFFNQLADQYINYNQQQAPEEQPIEQDAEIEDETEFIKNLRTMEEDGDMSDAKLLESFNEKLGTMQQQLDYQMEEMQNQMMAYSLLSSDEGQDYFTRMYDTNDDEVQFNLEGGFPSLTSLYFNSSGKQGMSNIGRKGAEIGNTISGMLGYKPTFNSVYRDPEQQQKYVAMGIGSPNSYHLTGDAVDMKPEDWNKLTKTQQSQLKTQYQVVFHNNHYHIEPK